MFGVVDPVIEKSPAATFGLEVRISLISFLPAATGVSVFVPSITDRHGSGAYGQGLHGR